MRNSRLSRQLHHPINASFLPTSNISQTSRKHLHQKTWQPHMTFNTEFCSSSCVFVAISSGPPPSQMSSDRLPVRFVNKLTKTHSAYHWITLSLSAQKLTQIFTVQFQFPATHYGAQNGDYGQWRKPGKTSASGLYSSSHQLSDNHNITTKGIATFSLNNISLMPIYSHYSC